MQVLVNIGYSALFGILGVLILAAGYVLFDKLIPLDFNKELGKNNVSVAIVIAGMLVGISIIVSRVVGA